VLAAAPAPIKLPAEIPDVVAVRFSVNN